MSRSVGPTTVLRHRAYVAAVELDDEVLLYDGMYLRRVPAIGALLWELVDGHRPAGQIAALLAAGRPGPEVGQVIADVMAYLSDLHDLMVLELAMLDRTTYRRPVEVGWVLDGQAVLLVDVRDGRRRALPPPGAQVWELVCDDVSAQEVVAALEVDYPDAPTLAGDVDALLQVLVQEGWLERHDAVVR